MTRGNRAAPILLVLTLAWVLYLAGCFEAERASTAVGEAPVPVVATPTPRESAAEAGTSVPEEPFVHTVEQGDLVTSIASKYNVTTDVILKANPGVDPGRLRVGQLLLIPGATTDPSVLDNPPSERGLGEIVRYVVQPGDNLELIATSYTVSVQAMLDANPEVDASVLQVGQQLIVPPYGEGLSAETLAASRTPVAGDGGIGDVRYHTVQDGDLLVAIAEFYRVDVDQIVALNGLGGDDQILIGQELMIPPPNH